MSKFKRIFKRAGRSLLSIILAGVPAYFTGNPTYLLCTPLIQALGKYLREKYGLINVPF